MTITFHDLILISPLIITGFTSVIIMLSIAFHRNHITSISIALSGFICSLFLIVILAVSNYTVDVTFLIRVDGFSLFYSALVVISGIWSIIFAYYWLKKIDDNKDEFYLLIMIATTGGILLSMSNHLVSMFIGIELITLPLLGLVVYSFDDKRSLEAGIKYMLMSLSTSFLLFGIALLYAELGDLNFEHIAEIIFNNNTHTYLLSIGLGMLIIGLCIKLSFFPFHLWTPDVYQGAPDSVSSFLLTGCKIGIFAVLFRFFTKVLINNEIVLIMFSVIAIASILFGNILAFTQKNLKRLFAYSSISNMGYLLVALVSAKSDKSISQLAVAIYLISYMFSSLGIFGIISTISNRKYNNDVNNINIFYGLFWHEPMLSIAMSIMVFSLAGIPITLGFIGKFYVIFSVMNSKIWWFIYFLIIGNIIGMYNYLRFISVLYMYKEKNNDFYDDKKQKLNIFFILICSVIVLVFGVWPNPIISIASIVID
ncbi:NADH-quinone oxidoreductase subunit N [Candidatus Providencia siddallii]|uniref:NADH-quinone oxidoreductase subunit N n=1 Tax=Candidatus Providencia siddallii TaxID=1715285 RepID=A0A0M6WAE3_9GAMM|nr:NADH-quinone oxidoreductase subunit N [Candidatus Providencia siddallii]